MALLGLGLKAVFKGASGLFRAVKRKVKAFKAKRKLATQEFKTEIKQGFGNLDPYAQGETYAPPNNPLGITAQPMGVQRVGLDDGFRPREPRSGKGFDIKSVPIWAWVAGGVSLLGGVFLATRPKTRRGRR